MVAVNSGVGVFVMRGVPVDGVFVGARVFSTNKSGVFDGSNENGVTVAGGVPGCPGIAVCRNGIDGNPLQLERTETTRRIKASFFIAPLR